MLMSKQAQMQIKVLRSVKIMRHMAALHPEHDAMLDV